MIGYITLGSNDIDKAAVFYDELLSGLGAIRGFDSDGFKAWSVGKDKPMFMLARPHDGNPATVGNGVMIALNAATPKQVDELHAKALALGGTNEGDPGLRSGAYYCAYFRDLDGNKLNFFCVSKAS